MQVVGYEPAPVGESEHAVLLFASDGAVSRCILEPDTALAYRVGSRHCAGTVEDDSHVPCPDDTAPYCDTHTNRWACARCTGNCSLPLKSCHESHAVYLAAFAPKTFKVGVTREWRLETRLREQGADRAVHLQTVENGRIARQREADIAADVGDAVRVPTKIRGLHQSVDESAWQALRERYDHVATFDFEYGLSLTDRPVAETIVTGTIRGTKGRILLLDHAGSTYAVDMRTLVGYEVEKGETERSLQSSFDAF